MPAVATAPIVLGPDGLTVTGHKFGLFSALDRKAGMGGRWAGGVTIDDLCGQGVPATEAVVCNPGDQNLNWGDITIDSGIGHDIEARELLLPVKCKMIGKDETRAKTISLFNRIEQSGWERALAEVAYLDGTAVGTAVTNVEAALAALLDEWYAVNGSQAVVHASPGVATLLGSHVLNRTDHAELRTGERLVIGAGYTAVLNQPNVLFATSDLVGFETGSEVIEIPDTTTNDWTVIVRRTILVGSQCPMFNVDLADTGLTG